MEFAGSARIRRASTDCAPEPILACTRMKIIHDKSTLGRPQPHGWAERLVRKVFEGAKALLSAAGLPPQFWPYAIRDYCFAENVKMIDGDSAWNKRFKKGHF